jgi:hypothetical protein
MVAETAIKTADYAFGNVLSATAAVAAAVIFVLFNYLSGKYDGVDHLDHRLGNVSRAVAGLGLTAEAVVGRCASENANVALSTKKYDPLFHYGDTLELLGSAAANARFKGQLYVKLDVYRIKSAIELHRVYGDMSPGYHRALCSYTSRPFNNIVAEVCKIDSCVFVAIPIATGIENAVGFNANGLLACATTEFVFCHITHNIFLP